MLEYDPLFADHIYSLSVDTLDPRPVCNTHMWDHAKDDPSHVDHMAWIPIPEVVLESLWTFLGSRVSGLAGIMSCLSSSDGGSSSSGGSGGGISSGGTSPQAQQTGKRSARQF